MKRRSFLACAGSAVVVAGAGLVACGAGGRPSDARGAKTPTRAWAGRNRLRIPPEYRPDAGRQPRFDLQLRTGRFAFLAGHPSDTWGVNGDFLGPTLRLQQGDHVIMNVRNALPEATTLHWHGMHVAAVADGGPHQPIAALGRWQPEWDVINRASTLWYHPHLHGQTALQAFRGVAGMIIVDDDVSRRLELPHTYGVDDIVCILTDRSIDANGAMQFDTVPTFGQMGSDMLVNGTMDAFLPVTTRRVRLRILNASSARRYRIGFSDGRRYAVIANDQGLLPAPVEVERIALGPGERAELIVECEPGESVIMNTVSGSEVIDNGDFSLLELRAGERLDDSAPLPTALGGPGPIVPAADARVRRFKLQGHDAINGAEMDLTRIDEVVPAGAVEIWELENTVYAHNFHVHGAEFSIFDRGSDAIEAWESGRKDSVDLPGKSTARIAVQFGRSTDTQHPYMYHCHLLRHEDDGMMGQFLVVDPGTADSVPRTVPMPTGGHH